MCNLPVMKDPETTSLGFAPFSPFFFRPPEWINTAPPDNPVEQLARAMDAAQAYYAVGAQTGVHAMIEWCGVMTEYVKMLQEAFKAGHEPDQVDKHHSTAVQVPDFMIRYFCEKLGCQLIPFIRGNPELWRQEFDKWAHEATSTHG